MDFWGKVLKSLLDFHDSYALFQNYISGNLTLALDEIKSLLSKSL